MFSGTRVELTEKLIQEGKDFLRDLLSGKRVTVFVRDETLIDSFPAHGGVAGPETCNEASPRFIRSWDTQVPRKIEACDPETAARHAWLDGGRAKFCNFDTSGPWTRPVARSGLREIASACRERGGDVRESMTAPTWQKLLRGGACHVGQDDLSRPPMPGACWGADALLGYSTHNPQQLHGRGCRAGGAMLAFGPDVFRRRRRRIRTRVVGSRRPCALAVSIVTDRWWRSAGITRQNVVAVFAAGADSVAVIGDLLA